jgi:hypothetical protein
MDVEFLVEFLLETYSPLYDLNTKKAYIETSINRLKAKENGNLYES